MSNTFMNSPRLLFTSESVTEGHPDKLCDQISDGVLDACLEQDPYSRVACETATKTGFVMLLGEITTHAFVNFDELVRKVVIEIGYDRAKKGFDGSTCGVLSAIASYFLAKRTLRPIENAMAAQARFTADASHELRTPLAAMKTEIEVALRDKKMNQIN